jgi:hypothetical protein
LPNHPSIDKKINQVMTITNKENQNSFMIPLPHRIAYFVPYFFFTLLASISSRSWLKKTVKYLMPQGIIPGTVPPST